MESALITAPPTRSAISSASADFPLQVGPATTRMTGTALPSLSRPAIPTPMSAILTLVAAREKLVLSDAIIARIRDQVRGGAPVILSPGEAADIPCAATPDMDAVRAAMGGLPIDALVTPAAERRKRLLVADMDSTIVTSETLDEIAAFAGLKEEIAAITRRSMNGEIDFAEALRTRVAMLKELTLDALEKTWRRT